MPFPTSAVLANAFVATAADPLPPSGHDLRPGTTRLEPGAATDVPVDGRQAAKPLWRGTFPAGPVDRSISSHGGFAWFGRPDQAHPFSDGRVGGR